MVMLEPNPGQSAEQYWETFYADGLSRWSGNPNGALVEECSDLSPGTALDLGCGQGGDAIWLAGRGWTVTATDVSTSALRVAESHAAEVGLGGRIDWQAHDLARSQPSGLFDLVTASFLHSPIELPWASILHGAAARAVAPGGTLLVVGHAPSPEHPEAPFPSPDEVLAGLDLPAGEWTIHTAELRSRLHAFAADQPPKERVDVVVRAQRMASGR